MAQLELVEFEKSGDNYVASGNTLVLENLEPSQIRKTVQMGWRKGRPRDSGIKVRFRNRIKEEYRIPGFCRKSKRIEIEKYSKLNSKYRMDWSTDAMKSPNRNPPPTYETVYVIFTKVVFQRFAGKKAAGTTKELFSYQIHLTRVRDDNIVP